MKKRVFSILLCLCMAVTLLPTAALAANTTSDFGDFSITYGDGTAPSFDSGTHTLTFGEAGEYTVAMKSKTASTSHVIVVDAEGDVKLNLNGVNITAPNGDDSRGADALTVASSGSATLNIVANSTLKGGVGSGFNEANIGGNGITGNVDISGTAKLKVAGGLSHHGTTAGSGIDGNASVSGSVQLEAVGNNGSTGTAGGNGVKGNLTVSGTAVVTASGGSGSAAITGSITVAPGYTVKAVTNASAVITVHRINGSHISVYHCDPAAHGGRLCGGFPGGSGRHRL